MVDLMLRIVGHVPRVSHVTGIFTQLWGDNAIDVSPTQTLWGRVFLSRVIYAPVHLLRATGTGSRVRMEI